MLAYPEAKIIVTVRDVDKWFDSMQSTIWTQDPAGSEMRRLLHKYLWRSDEEGMGEQVFK